MQNAITQAGRPLIDYIVQLETNPPKTLSPFANWNFSQLSLGLVFMYLYL